jgi:hypothetical protein
MSRYNTTNGSIGHGAQVGAPVSILKPKAQSQMESLPTDKKETRRADPSIRSHAGHGVDRGHDEAGDDGDRPLERRAAAPHVRRRRRLGPCSTYTSVSDTSNLHKRLRHIGSVLFELLPAPAEGEAGVCPAGDVVGAVPQLLRGGVLTLHSAGRPSARVLLTLSMPSAAGSLLSATQRHSGFEVTTVASAVQHDLGGAVSFPVM